MGPYAVFLRSTVSAGRYLGLVPLMLPKKQRGFIVGACLAASTLCATLAASVAAHLAIFGLPSFNVGDKPAVAATEVPGSDGSKVLLRVQLTNNTAKLPPDFVANNNDPGSTSTPAGVAGRGAVVPPAGSTITGELLNALATKQSVSADVAQRSFFIEGPAVSDSQLVFLFREHIACQGATKAGAPAGSCQAGGFGNDNCYCNWRNSEPTEASYNPAAYASGLSAWRSAGRPNLANIQGRLYNNRFYWGPSEADASPLYMGTALTCPAGQTLDYKTSSCQMSSLADGKCDYYRPDPFSPNFVANPHDPDCAKVSNAVTSRPDGGVDIKNPDGSRASVMRDPAGNIVIARTVPSSGKTTDKETATIAPGSPDGKSPEGLIQQGQAVLDGISDIPPIPWPEGTGSGGTGTGTGTGSGTGSGSCGGSGQPACKMEQVGKGSFNLGSFDGNGGLPSGVQAKLDDYKTSTFAVSAECPADAFAFTVPFPEFLGGPVNLASLTPGGLGFCSVIDPWVPVLRVVEAAFAALLAVFILLGA